MDKGSDILEKLIYASNIRHRVITSNIANADTPNYKAKDVDFKGFIKGEMDGLVTTDARHIGKPGPSQGPGEIVAETVPSWGDGNNVELDMEVAKMTENGLLFESSVKMLATKMRMFRTAITGR